MVKIPESMQKVLDAFLTVLGFKTVKARTQAIKDFKDRKLDLLKTAKTIKPGDLAFGDCKQIQEMLSGLEPDKVGTVNVACRDLMKWTTNMIQLRVAEVIYPDATKATATPSKPESKAKVTKETDETKVTKSEEPQAKDVEESKQDAEQPQVEQPQAEQPQAEQPQAEQPQAEQPQAEQPQAEQPQAEQPQAEQPQNIEKSQDEKPTDKTKKQSKKTPGKRASTAASKKTKTKGDGEESKKVYLLYFPTLF